MQFHLNGFQPGDPDISPAATPAQSDGLPEAVDVLIVGSGPAGLTLAAQMSAFPDITTRLVESKPGPRHQLGVHFFKRGNPEIFNVSNKFQYNLSLYDLIKTYGNIITKSDEEKITIANTRLFSVENATIRLKKLLKGSKDWKSLLDFIPNDIKSELENKSALASHFVASLELVKEGNANIKQDNIEDEIFLSSKI